MSRENLATPNAESEGNEPEHHAFAGLSPEEFKFAFRNHAAGVALITADPGTGPVALTATSVFSVSAEPPLFVFSLSSTSSSSAAIQASETLVVHLLGASQLDLARLGSTSGVDRFADTSLWSRLPTGEPYFLGASAWIRGTVINRMEAGASTIVAVHAIEAHVPDDSEATTPLVYHNRTWHHLGEHSRLR
ncbi:flavin reductase family protein [Rathayibacter iranicus]|uniref:Flavin reductase n=2 Tax=Rathayibacter iranicus TaxID=59737 RepID=A0AAD2JG03_9MICO|nr:flavin reductase family protein [Rathayibacter iranicus]AZZ54813.1 flavin reductase [Rathayibacter iranicus]MWV31377.1 flavin reductase [Rathayibacter iranicus NCPPB 2253 = VKM Ac-1602]PPI50406.1 flavin oxidoreductase [Rathayibacter iranicus]PPI62732.1 flavin oxidoreductase [Rathayibacter iranicus]PPI73805.1 flavin oxidoreductase [Rathayibacter iranicus]